MQNLHVYLYMYIEMYVCVCIYGITHIEYGL